LREIAALKAKQCQLITRIKQIYYDTPALPNDT